MPVGGHLPHLKRLSCSTFTVKHVLLSFDVVKLAFFGVSKAAEPAVQRN